MSDFLGLEGLRLVEATGALVGADGVREVHVEADFVPGACPKCGQRDLYRHGARPQRYVDVPHFGEATHLIVHRRRWRCRSCPTTFPDPLPAMDEVRQATNRLVRYVRKRCLIHTFAEIGRDVGLSNVSIRNIFDDMLADYERRFRFVTPRYLGIDEVMITGQYRCMLTNVERNTVFDLLDSRRMATLRDYFADFPDPKSVEIFTTDLWGNYATVHREFFPHAVLVADRFHIARMGENGVEAARKAYRKGLSKRDRIQLKDDRFLLLRLGERLTVAQSAALDALFAQHPELKSAWACKERFFGIWSARDRVEAGERMTAWLAAVPVHLKPYFREAIGACLSRRQHILNYFDHPITNAYTESINRLAKSINRMGRGYSLEVVRAKMLYHPHALAKGAMVERRVVAAQPGPEDAATAEFFAQFRSPDAGRGRVVERTLYYGAHIPTLCDLLEGGAFDGARPEGS